MKNLTQNFFTQHNEISRNQVSFKVTGMLLELTRSPINLAQNLDNLEQNFPVRVHISPEIQLIRPNVSSASG